MSPAAGRTPHFLSAMTNSNRAGTFCSTRGERAMHEIEFCFSVCESPESFLTVCSVRSESPDNSLSGMPTNANSPHSKLRGLSLGFEYLSQLRIRPHQATSEPDQRRSSGSSWRKLDEHCRHRSSGGSMPWAQQEELVPQREQWQELELEQQGQQLASKQVRYRILRSRCQHRGSRRLDRRSHHRRIRCRRSPQCRLD